MTVYIKGGYLKRRSMQKNARSITTPPPHTHTHTYTHTPGEGGASFVGRV